MVVMGEKSGGGCDGMMKRSERGEGEEEDMMGKKEWRKMMRRSERGEREEEDMMGKKEWRKMMRRKRK